MEYGYDYYVCAWRKIMEKIEAKRVFRCEEAAWDYMCIPKPFRNKSKPQLCKEFQVVKFKEDWILGRSIHQVVVNIWGPGWKMVQILHPDFYC